MPHRRRQLTWCFAEKWSNSQQPVPIELSESEALKRGLGLLLAQPRVTMSTWNPQFPHSYVHVDMNSSMTEFVADW